MSLLTANTLFHFAGKTDDVKGKEALLNILETSFRPSYCKEFGKEEMYSEIRNRAIVEVNVPMVCFCDLPLSKLQKHIHTYGKYGLGMSKQWGQHKGLNPVNYVTPDSHLLDFIVII